MLKNIVTKFAFVAREYAFMRLQTEGYLPVATGKYVVSSVTTLCHFESFRQKKFLTKVAQISGYLLGYFQNHHFLSKKTDVATFLGIFWKCLAYNLFQHLVTLVASDVVTESLRGLFKSTYQFVLIV